MKVQLNHKFGYYELNSANELYVFNLKQIKNMTITKKFDMISLLKFFLILLPTYIIIFHFYGFDLPMFLIIIFYSFLWYKSFIYKPIYAIKLTIHSNHFSIETKDEELIQNFVMLHYFYYDYLESNYNLLIDLGLKRYDKVI